MCAKDYERILKSVPLFSGLNSMDLERVSRLVIRRKVKKGQVIISENQALDGFYIVLSGQVKVYKLSPDGKEQIIHIIYPGESFAEAAAFTDGRSPANAQAMVESEVFFIFKNDIVRLVKDNPQLSLNMLASMSRYLRHMVSVIDELSLKEVPARLAKYLLDLSVTGKTKEIKLPTTKQELASRLGTVSEVLSRAFSKLKSKRIIKAEGGNKITIINKNALEQTAAGVKS
jgi:CRP/FNR family transcriptional regulator